MKGKYLWLALLFAASSAIGAETKDYKICSIGGYFAGTSDKFLSGLAAHIAQKKKVFDDPICVAAWKNARRLGAHYAQTEKIESEAEDIAVKQATEFSTQVYEAVGSILKY